MRWICLIFLVILNSGINAQSKARDTIYLYNGQILIGDIRDANFGEITIDEMDLKMTSIKLYKIKRLVINDRFRIETLDKRFFEGMLGPSEKEGYIDLYPDHAVKESMLITHIFTLVPLDKDFIRRIHGNISAGFSFTKSSNIGQLNGSANAQYATRKLDYAAFISEIGSIDSGKYSRDNESAQLYSNYNLTPT